MCDTTNFTRLFLNTNELKPSRPVYPVSEVVMRVSNLVSAVLVASISLGVGGCVAEVSFQDDDRPEDDTELTYSWHDHNNYNFIAVCDDSNSGTECSDCCVANGYSDIILGVGEPCGCTYDVVDDGTCAGADWDECGNCCMKAGFEGWDHPDTDGEQPCECVGVSKDKPTDDEDNE